MKEKLILNKLGCVIARGYFPEKVHSALVASWITRDGCPVGLDQLKATGEKRILKRFKNEILPGVIKKEGEGEGFYILENDTQDFYPVEG